MKKTNKKILFVVFILIASAISLMILQVNALSLIVTDDISYSYEGMSAEKAEQIVRVISETPDKILIQPFNILCLFGHSIQTGTILQTEHNYYSTAPRCKETTYFVEYCTRSDCDYFKITGESINRTGCH
jgi:hypothetical protein